MNLELKIDERFTGDLLGKTSVFDGVQYLFEFANGYGASVVKHSGSYGGKIDLWELGLEKFYRDGSYALMYTSLVNFDVCGFLTDDEVNNYLSLIKNGEIGELEEDEEETEDRVMTETDKIAWLITDMTLGRAPVEHLERAIKHSIVVINTKCDADIKQSEIDNGIEELRMLYSSEES